MPNVKLQEIIDNLKLLPERDDRIQMLISLAERFQQVPEAVAERPFPEANRVPSCESEAFVFPVRQDDGTFKFHFAVDNPQGVSAMATAAILDQAFSGAPLQEVAQLREDVIYDIFGRELSMGKSMGLMCMVGMVQKAAKKALAAGAEP